MDVMNDIPASAPSDGLSYDDIFPSLPTSNTGSITSCWNDNSLSKLSIKSHTITQVFQVPVEERRYKDVQGFGNETNNTRKKISEKYSVKIEICCSKDQSLHIVITGHEDKVLEAKRAIITELQTEKEHKLKVPKDLHKFIIGKSGAVLKALQEKTCTSIQVPKPDQNLDYLTITGPKDGIDQAIHEIHLICDEQSKTGVARLNIPKIYHPWIRGPYNDTVNKIMQATGAKINIPPPDSESSKDEITITGDKEKVDLAYNEVMKIYSQKQKCNITKIAVQITKNQHRLIIGKNGSTVQEIFRDYDVYVHVPRADLNSETITLYGEDSRVGTALTQVYAKANSIIKTQIAAPSWLHRYMIGEKGANISKITADYPGTHVEFENDNKITLEGPPDEIEKVKDRLTNITQELEKMMSYDEINIDPKYFGHVIGKSYENVSRMKQDYGVQIRIPNQETNVTGRPQSTIRIEGAKEGVEKAKAELTELLKRVENERSKDVIIDQKYHSNLIGQGGKNISEIRSKFNNINITIPNASEKSDVVTVRGNKEDVEKCVKYLQKFVKDMDESSYREEMQIFKKFHRLIIGKQGVAIKKIKDETNTRIDIPEDSSESDTIVITGKKENVLKAKKAIDDKVKELIKIEEDTISIPHNFHNALIGRGGAIINQIRKDCGGVIINFPPENKPSDIITLKGPREEIEKAKIELQKVFKEKNEISYSEDVNANPEFHRYLIGKKGNNINQIKDKYSVRILFPKLEGANEKAGESTSANNVITIIGKQENVVSARQEIEAAIKNLEEQVTEEVTVDPKWQKNFLAKRAKLKNKISAENCNVEINFPKTGSNSNQVTIKGPKEAVQSAKNKINEMVHEFINSITIELQVEQKYHVSIIGKKGANSQNICETYRVELQFPAKSTQNGENGVVNNEDNDDESKKPPSNSDVIYISGLREDCEKAKAAILALVPTSEKMDFPNEFHKYLLSEKAVIVRDISAAHNVQINIPKKEDILDYITITGTSENIEKAKEALKEKLGDFEEKKKDRELKSFTVEFEINPNFIQILRGKQGVEAQKLSESYNCQINFSRKGEPDKVVIKGYEKNVLEAKEGILNKIKELESKVSQELKIDLRVHPRIIGTKGKNLKKITDQFKVDIKFAGRSNASDVVIVTGDNADLVEEACDYLKNLEEEYLQDVAEKQAYMHPSSIEKESDSQPANANGFVVKGAPWEQAQPVQAPDTSNMEDFPTITSSLGSGASFSKLSWGPSRK